MNLVFAFDPGLIVLGGGAMGELDEAEELLGPIRNAVVAEFGDAAQHRMTPAIEASRFGPTAAAVGAALLSRTEPPHRRVQLKGTGQ